MTQVPLATTHPAVLVSEPSAVEKPNPPFPWVLAALVSIAFFLSENYWPADVIGFSDLDTNVSQLQGSIIRELGYPMIGLIGITWLLRAKSRRLAWKSPFVIAFGLLAVWCVLSVAWSQQPLTSAKRIVACFLMFTGAAGAAATWTHKQILQFISLSGAAQLTIGVAAEIAIGHFTPWVSDYRFAGTLHWNAQGFCCLILVLSSLAASDAAPEYKTLFRAIALYGLFFLVLTKSRSSLMGLAIGLFVYYMFTWSAKSKVAASLTLSASILLLYMSGILNSLLAVLSRNGEGMDDFTGRGPMWQLALTFVRQRPLIGFGYQGFWTVANVDDFSSEFHWTISSAHNSYIELILSLGYIGMSLHVLVLILGILRSRSLSRGRRLPVVALAAAVFTVYLAVGTLESINIPTPGPYCFYTALLLWNLCFETTDSRHPLGIYYTI